VSPELFRYVKLAHDQRRRQARWLLASRILGLAAAFFAGVTVGLLVAQW